jgi:hypothetical protein
VRGRVLSGKLLTRALPGGRKCNSGYFAALLPPQRAYVSLQRGSIAPTLSASQVAVARPATLYLIDRPLHGQECVPKRVGGSAAKFLARSASSCEDSVVGRSTVDPQKRRPTRNWRDSMHNLPGKCIPSAIALLPNAKHQLDARGI